MQYHTYLIIILSLPLHLSTATITLLLNYPITNSTGNSVSAFGYHSTPEQIVTNINNPIINQLLILTPSIIINSSSPMLTFESKYMRGNDKIAYQYRIKNISAHNNSFIRYYSNTCQLILNPNTLSFLQLASTPPTQIIKQCLFTPTNNQYLLISYNTITQQYQIDLCNISSNLINSSIITWSAADLYRYSFVRSGLYFVVFQDGVCVGGVGVGLGEYWRMGYAVGVGQILTVDVYEQYIICSHGHQLYLYNITNNFTIITNLTHPQQILTLKLLSYSSILIITQTGLYQYQLYPYTVLSSILRVFTLSARLDVINGSYVIVYACYPENYTELGVYYLDNSGDLSYNVSNTTNITEISGGYNLSTNLSAYYESSSLSQQQSVVIPPQQSINLLEQQLYFLTIAAQYSPNISQNIGKIMHISSIKIISKYIVLLIMILDDLQYYQYHKYNYTQSIQFMIQSVNVVNGVRFLAWFLGRDVSGLLEGKFQGEEEKYRRMFVEDGRNPSYFYFVSASRFVYLDNLAIVLFMFLVMKVLYGGCYVCRMRHRWFRFVCDWFYFNTKWWVLVVIFLENNMANLTFNIFVQLQGEMVSSFNFWNKLNLLAAVLILLCLIIYSICLYALVYTFTSRKSAKVLLNNSQYMRRSFVWEEFSRVTRNLIRSFFHGFFIFNYKMQIVGLAWSNILYLILTFTVKDSFHNKAIFLLFILYYTAFFIFDLTLALKFLTPKIFKLINYNMLNFICISFMVIIGLAITLISIARIILFLINKISTKKAPQKNQQDKNLEKNEVYIKKKELNAQQIFIKVIKLQKKVKKTGQIQKSQKQNLFQIRKAKNQQKRKNIINVIYKNKINTIKQIQTQPMKKAQEVIHEQDHSQGKE